MRIKTGYSFGNAFGHLPSVISRLQEVGMKFAPISDRMSTFGFTRWTKAAKKAELKPIYGVELAVTSQWGDKKPIIDYWTFFARSSLRPLHDLVERATCGPDKEPSLVITSALNNPDLFIIAGERLLVEALPKSLPDNFALALSPATPKGLITRAKERGIPLIASSANVYPRAEDLELYRITLGWRSSTQTYPQHILSDEEWREATAHLVSEVEQTNALAVRDAWMAGCDATMKKAKLLSPEKPKTLREMCEESASRKGVDLSDEVYSERLTRELRLIAEKEFDDYFYILSDMIRWAKKRMVVGPARGSSCGSLVCYLLDITEIDPIPFGLIFERFIDINRMDLPDIDVDFSDVNRDQVFRYAEERYGAEHVARLGTVGLFKARSAIKQAGAALHIPGWRTDKVLDSIIERSSGDARAMNTLEDTLNQTDAGRALVKDHPELLVSVSLEGHPDIPSQHAAGMLITDEPMTEFVAVNRRTKAAMCDKKDSEELNLLKIDALGLTQLSIFERTLELIGEKPVSGWLEKLPLDDPAAFEVLNAAKFTGLFQFTGTAMRQLAGQIKFRNIEDIIAMTALARPGPLASGGAQSWIKRQRGEEPPTTAHPMLDELTKETYGVVIYQETVMRIVREMGCMSWEDTSAIRKSMSGRLGDEFFAQFWVKFRDGAAKNGVDEATAKGIWDQINTFGSWSFNRSHAVAYGIVSYWCCWLKAHHPVEFAAATLDAEKLPSKQIAILRELAREGVAYVAVDPDHSTDRWSIADKDGVRTLIGPLNSIKGIGPAKVREVLDARREGKELRPAIKKQLAQAKTDIDSLFPIRDRVAKLHPDLAAINILTKPTDCVDCQPGIRGPVVIIVRAKKIVPRDANEAINITKRGYEMRGPTAYLNLFVEDDTDELFCNVHRHDYDRLAKKVVEEGRAGKSLYAIKGTIPSDFRMLRIEAIRYLGEFDGE